WVCEGHGRCDDLATPAVWTRSRVNATRNDPAAEPRIDWEMPIPVQRDGSRREENRRGVTVKLRRRAASHAALRKSLPRDSRPPGSGVDGQGFLLSLFGRIAVATARF